MFSHSASCCSIFANVGRASRLVMACSLQRPEHRQVQAGPGLRLSVRSLLIGAYRSTTRCLVSRCTVCTTWSAATLAMLQHTPTAVCKLMMRIEIPTEREVEAPALEAQTFPSGKRYQVLRLAFLAPTDKPVRCNHSESRTVIRVERHPAEQ